MMKMIYNKLKKTVLLASIAVCLVSCLEKVPGDAIPEGDGMKTFNDAEQTLTGIYSAYKINCYDIIRDEERRLR